ncbi:F-box domain [Arabidopsis suecica]|uniref:F-box domain n=1 Tax=Arabidopsis suecica TaxID=45249 RepID=A0A8T1YRQ9_ARASU|nr:F-box domain [Arabidopsis suecica]
MTSMISSLPRELIEEIISRVPLRSMKALRLTCKSFNNLSNSESFTKMHIDKAATRKEKTMMISMMPHNLYLMSVTVDDVDPSVELKGQLSLLDNQVSIYRVFHYEGLLLCIFEDPTRVVVWNPYLGQARWIQIRFSHLSIGWDSFRCEYEIYDFDSSLWKTLDVTPHWWISCSSYGVSLKGNTYWPAKMSSRGVFDHIICFDFTRESFGPLLPLPFGATDRGYPYVTLSCVKEEKLAALFQHYYSNCKCEYEIDIWITTKIEDEMVSWSKFLRMDTKANIYPIVFFIDEEKKIFMSLDSEFPKAFLSTIGEAKLRKLDLEVSEGQYCGPPVCSYVPSLVQIKKPTLSQKDETK